MADVNQNWDRWIFASISKHFETNKSASIHLFVEGEPRETASQLNWVELRIDGPDWTELSSGFFRGRIEVNVLCSATETSDTQSIRRLAGEIQSIFKSGIAVYKYGLGDDDDKSLLGCLTLLTDHRGKLGIKARYFGRVEVNTPMQQASVEAHYEVEFTL